MSITIKKLCRENGNPFQLSLCAGQTSVRNEVTWVYGVEDDYIITYFQGSELAVTTCMKQEFQSDWLMDLVKKLIERRAAGLIVNVGKFVIDIPQDVLDYCNEKEFPLLTMPWEIRLTDLLQTFCKRIVQEQHESTIHDKAMRDAILRRDNEEEYREILSKYYDLSGKFMVILIYIKMSNEDGKEDGMELFLINRIRRFKTKHGLKSCKIGLITYEHYELMILNNTDERLLPDIRKIILELYSEAAREKKLFIGVGIGVDGLENIGRSYHRAQTAMRMALYRNTPYVKFEDMGFYKILFSIKEEQLLYSYADEMLAPLDAYDKNKHEYVELLKVYIQNDRSLERTASAMYLHRNTVNYRIQKMKELLNSPLKTLEDMFPYQVALAIRDMQNHVAVQENGNRSV